MKTKTDRELFVLVHDLGSFSKIIVYLLVSNKSYSIKDVTRVWEHYRSLSPERRSLDYMLFKTLK